MEMSAFIYMLIEAVLFLSGFAVLFIKLGHHKKELEDVVEKTKGYPEWKSATDTKIQVLQDNDNNQSKLLESMNNTLIKIATQVELIYDSKVKINEK